MTRGLKTNSSVDVLTARDEEGVVWELVGGTSILTRLDCGCEFPDLARVYQNKAGKTKCMACLFHEHPTTETGEEDGATETGEA